MLYPKSDAIQKELARKPGLSVNSGLEHKRRGYEGRWTTQYD
jgi:hypothetical protein